VGFKQAKGNATMAACVFPARGKLFKGVLRVTTTHHDNQIQRVTGSSCGRSMCSSAQALKLARVEARCIPGF
jgi:hypothetical protein